MSTRRGLPAHLRQYFRYALLTSDALAHFKRPEGGTNLHARTFANNIQHFHFLLLTNRKIKRVYVQLLIEPFTCLYFPPLFSCLGRVELQVLHSICFVEAIASSLSTLKFPLQKARREAHTKRIFKVICFWKKVLGTAICSKRCPC